MAEIGLNPKTLIAFLFASAVVIWLLQKREVRINQRAVVAAMALVSLGFLLILGIKGGTPLPFHWDFVPAILAYRSERMACFLGIALILTWLAIRPSSEEESPLSYEPALVGAVMAFLFSANAFSLLSAWVLADVLFTFREGGLQSKASLAWLMSGLTGALGFTAAITWQGHLPSLSIALFLLASLARARFFPLPLALRSRSDFLAALSATTMGFYLLTLVSEGFQGALKLAILAWLILGAALLVLRFRQQRGKGVSLPWDCLLYTSPSPRD